MDIENGLNREDLKRTSLPGSFDNDHIELIDEIMNESFYTFRLFNLRVTDLADRPGSVLLDRYPGKARGGGQDRTRLPSGSPIEMANRQSAS
jgi:hypothetical protein